MVFELKCQNCGAITYFDTEAPQGETFQKCPKCETVLVLASEERMRNIERIKDFDVISIVKEHKRSVMDDDFNRLIESYENSDEDGKKRISAIVAWVYLIINRGDKEELLELYNFLKSKFLGNIKEI